MNNIANIPPNSHPGVYLRKMLEERGWAQTDLTFILGCHPKAVNQIINEKQGISPSMSKALAEAFGITTEYFADLQNAYDLACANAPNPSVSLRAKMQNNYPIREMIKRGWLKDDGAEGLLNQLAQFFEVNDADEVPYMAHAAKKSSYEEREIPAAQLAWLFRVRQIAKSMVVPKFSEQSLHKAIAQMRQMLVEPEEARHVPRVLAECGVRFVMVEVLPQAKIDGVCFWLDESSPVIGISARHDRIDNFWFVLRHEIEHVLRGDGKGSAVVIDAELEGARAGTDNSLPEEERLANLAASNFCVSTEKIESFIARKNPFYYEKDVLAFSKLQGTHPGIVVGQMQHRLGRYDYLKRYQVKIRHLILPGAMADGWGQTATA